MKNLQKAFGYIRVSGRGQIKGDGFERQNDAILHYAKSHNIEILQTFKEEGVSGTKTESERPAFQDMVSEILKNGVRVVIIEGMDRLAREYRIQEQLLIYLASKGIELISARTEENVTQAILDDPMKKALVQIQGVFAELEKSLLVKKLRLARERKKATEGKCEGRKGYADTDEGRELIKTIKRLRRKPQGKRKRMTFDKVAVKLNEQGLNRADGKSFTGLDVRLLMHRLKKG